MLAHSGQRSREETAMPGAGSHSRAARTGIGVRVERWMEGVKAQVSATCECSIIEREERGGFEETLLTII